MPISAMIRENELAPLRLVLLAAPETSAAVLYCLHEVFSSVGRVWEGLTGEPASSRSVSVTIAARDGTRFASTLGVPVVPDASLHDAGEPDIVVVPDLDLNGGSDTRGRWPAESAWLRARHASGATVCSVCTGSVMLAESGLLDGLEATSHWGVTRLFEAAYPAVRLTPERILVPAGPDQRIVTAGGSASWSELALYLIARFCGREEAVRTAKVFLLGDRSEGQLPFAAMVRPGRHGDAVVQSCQVWIAEHYAMPNPVARMIARSGLPPRTFKRRFRQATGYAPIAYVQTLRVEEAKQLLETTADPVEEIAASVGYQDPASFRRLFKRLTGVTPARHRQRFRVLGGVVGDAAGRPAPPDRPGLTAGAPGARQAEPW